MMMIGDAQTVKDLNGNVFKNKALTLVHRTETLGMRFFHLEVISQRCVSALVSFSVIFSQQAVHTHTHTHTS